MNELIRFLNQNEGGLPVWWWIIILFPNIELGRRFKKHDKKLSKKQMAAVKAAFDSASRRGGMTVVTHIPETPKCRHQNAVPVQLCDWHEPMLEGDGELVAWWCDDCKTQLPRKFSPGVREVDIRTGQEVNGGAGAFNGVVDYWSTAANAPKTSLTVDEIAEMLNKAGITPADVVEVTSISDREPKYLPKTSKAERIFLTMEANGYHIVRDPKTGELVWNNPSALQ